MRKEKVKEQIINIQQYSEENPDGVDIYEVLEDTAKLGESTQQTLTKQLCGIIWLGYLKEQLEVVYKARIAELNNFTKEDICNKLCEEGTIEPNTVPVFQVLTEAIDKDGYTVLNTMQQRLSETNSSDVSFNTLQDYFDPKVLLSNPLRLEEFKNLPEEMTRTILVTNKDLKSLYEQSKIPAIYNSFATVETTHSLKLSKKTTNQVVSTPETEPSEPKE